MNARQQRFIARKSFDRKLEWGINIALLLIILGMFFVILNLAFDAIGQRVCRTATPEYAKELSCDR